MIVSGLGARDCEAEGQADVDAPLFATASVGATVDGPPSFASARVDVDAPLPVLDVDVDAPPPPPAAVRIDADARHGGQVVAAGPHAIEVVPHASGEVHAYVQGPAPPEAQLTVDVPVRGRGRGRPVRLEWNADARRYEGTAPRGVVIVPGPAVVHYRVGPRVYDVRTPHVVVAPAIVVDVHGPRVRVRRGKFRHHKHRRRHGHGHGHGLGHGRGHGRGHGGVAIDVH